MTMQSYASGYAIYGVWFYPEEDREKILNLLNGYVQAICLYVVALGTDG